MLEKIYFIVNIQYVIFRPLAFVEHAYMTKINKFVYLDLFICLSRSFMFDKGQRPKYHILLTIKYIFF